MPRGRSTESRKTYDERFYSCWVPGLVELIFPDWHESPELSSPGIGFKQSATCDSEKTAH
jgi:hypothetical protein